MTPFLLALLSLLTAPCGAPRLAAHKQADLARAIVGAQALLSAPPSDDPEAGLDLLFVPLQGKGLIFLMSLLGAGEGEGEGFPVGMSGIWAETDSSGGEVRRLWVAGAPTSPHRIHFVAVDLLLFEGPWGSHLRDPDLSAASGYDRDFVSTPFPSEPIHLERSAIDARGVILGHTVDWMPDCPRRGPLLQ